MSFPPVEEHIVKRISQASKVTSTPQKNISSSSPDVSSIRSGSETRYNSIDSFDLGEGFQVVNPCSNDCCEDFKYLRGNTLKKAGKFWELFKPKNPETLFDMIFYSPNSSEKIAYDLLSRYRANPKKIILPILKLFIDISGYQRLDIRDVYEYEACNGKQAIYLLQNQILDSDLMDAQTSLMQESNSKNCLLIRTALFDFIQKLVHTAHHLDILYDQAFPLHIFGFIKCMAFSVLKNIRYTGILFTVKLMSACCNIYCQITNEINNHSNPSLIKLKHQQYKILKYLDLFYLIFNNNCLIPDRSAYFIRMACAKEMIHWITYIPKYIISEKRIVRLLKKLLQDESSDVRLCALGTCEHFINLDTHTPDMIENLKSLIKIMETRIYDINYFIASKACMVLRKLFQKYPTYIESDIFKSICCLINHKNEDLSNAASQFVILYLRSISNNNRELIINIVKLSEIQIFKNKLFLFIKALLEFTPELQNWKNLLSLILDEALALRLRKSLLMIMYNVVLINTDSLSKDNNMSADTVPELNDNKYICLYIIPYATNLLHIYEDDESKNYILKMIIAIDLSEVKNRDDICWNEILLSAENLILKSSEPDIIKTGVSLLSHLYTQSFDISRSALRIANKITHYLYRKFQECKEHPKNPESVTNIYNITLKLSILYKAFDLTDYFSWRDICKQVKFTLSNVTKNYIILSKHYLIWSMKRTIESHSSNEQPKLDVELTKLSAKCREYLEKCFGMLEINANISLSLVAFECICDLVYTYHNYLEEIVKFNQAFKVLYIKIDEDQYSSKLYQFFKKRILENTSMPLKERQVTFCKLIELLYVGILPASMLSNILIIYSEHSVEYLDIFNSLFDELQRNEGFVPTILLTLKEGYEESFTESEIANFNNDRFKELCTLAKKLSTIKKISMKNFKEIISFGIDYVFRGNKNYVFLYLLKYFVKRLGDHDKKEILERLQQVASDYDKNQAAVLYFVKIIKGIDSNQNET